MLSLKMYFICMFLQNVGDGYTIIQHQLDMCESDHQEYFQWTILAIKGLILLFGCFLAWETRNVRYEECSHTIISK